MTAIETPNLADELAGCLSAASVIRRDEPMAKHTTLRVGGLKFFILGRGSNLIVRDGGFRGVVICLSQPHFSLVEIDGLRIRAGAGARQKTVAVEAKRHGLSGVEFLEGIPGSIGGALRMNAGAMGGATFDAVESVRVMNYSGEVRDLTLSEMAVEYRCCTTLKTQIALCVVFQCKPEPRESIEVRMKAYSEKRWSSQPAAPSAGCMFKNPPMIAAGKLIDELGLKGKQIGAARISLEHGNFLVNDGGATARDVLELIGFLKAKAKAERGIELHQEVEVIGE